MANLHINGRVWLEAQERFFGIGRMELLERIQQTGSINQAAKEMKMSYKRAWELVQSMNSQADAPLVSTQTGGERGGGAVVTEEGLKYLTYYRGLQERFQQFLAQEIHHLPV
ncbi:molybdate transport system regulatory protein [Larkinella arboricola]|uniref:Molybdate transport system regulatory protein n=1 Tax=Larkinella arboricola TaxID=643671 RepID=A0A327X6X4_LARAB|nr:winged helix-turn-helix domain-containing protein [Larkinella arboricola]RAK02715.1 molybdate transport system regulatory protein [Larkinella arboricola]